MPFKDLREFIAMCEKEGEVRRIEEEVDWNLEAGAILRYSYEKPGLPAPFFQRVKDYPKGYRLFGGTLGSCKRMAIAMDLDPNTPQSELIEEYTRRIKRPIKPRIVKDAPCKENILMGDQVDVLKFPVPQIIPDDGARYIGTLDLVISKGMNSDFVNWGTYRVAVHNRNTLGLLIHPYTHMGTQLRTEYEPAGKPMEVAVVISADPISTWLGGIPVPYGVSEADIAGGMRGEPVELVKCETIDLMVPATAEIVIEGELRPGDRMDEGPFGEYAGYMASLREPRPVIHVKAITHRNDPILTMAAPGVPMYEGLMSASVTRAAELLEALRGRGLPVTGVNVPPEGGCLLAVVAVKSLFGNIAEQVSHVVWGAVGGIIIPYLIVVDSDVDPLNMGEVVHALVSKCHPYRGIVRLEHTLGSPLWPFLNAYERLHKLGARAYFDCTWPVDWNKADVPARVAFREIYPQEVQQKATDKWQRAIGKGGKV
jgi:4-hydroxy-3-polyprenylbenzoate decarboxylase